MQLSDTLSVVIPIATTLVGAVWYLSYKISSMDLRLKLFLRQLENVEREIDVARTGRAKLWEKHSLLSERVTVQETKNP